MTVELDIKRQLAHLRWVGGTAVTVQRRYTGGCITEMAWRQVRQHSIDLHRVRKSVHGVGKAEQWGLPVEVTKMTREARREDIE